MLALLMGMLTFTFRVQPAKAKPKTWTMDDDGSGPTRLVANNKFDIKGVTVPIGNFGKTCPKKTTTIQIFHSSTNTQHLQEPSSNNMFYSCTRMLIFFTLESCKQATIEDFSEKLIS